MKKIILALSISLFLSACGKEIPPTPVPLTGAITGVKAPCENLTYYGFPIEKHISKNTYFICRKGYALNYNPKRKISNWTVELLTRQNLLKKDSHKDINDTRPDPDIDPTVRTYKNDYKGTGYLLGHFISPMDYQYNDVLFSQAHYLSNYMPINPTEKKAWKTLNKLIRKAAIHRGKLYVVSGPVYLNGTGLGWVGRSNRITSSSAKTANRGKIQIPTYYFKVLFDPKRSQSIAYIVSNKTTKRPVIKALSVSQLEKISELHFAPDLPRAKAEKLKQQYQPEKWLHN